MILAAYNPKGGVGKTTMAVNLATVFAQQGRSVLLVDLEADMNASISLGISPVRSSPSIVDALVRARRPSDVVRPVSGIPRLHLATGGARLAHTDELLRNVRQPERRLADVLRPLAAAFDTVIVDAPAQFSLLAQSVPAAADHLLVPVRAEYLSLESLAHFLRWYRDRREARRATAAVAGILLTHVDHRRQATREIVEIIRTHNRRGVFRAEIPSDPRASEAPSHGVPLVVYAPSSRAALAYRQLAGELLHRLSRTAH
jgi:chromosome partitioning protein